MNQRLSYYNALTDIKSTVTITLENFIDSLRSGTHTDNILKIREFKAQGKAYGNLKKQLPLVSISGTFKAHFDDDIIEHSGLICIDFDDFDNQEDAEGIRDHLASDKYTLASFLSASGNVAIIVRIDPVRHKDSFTCLDAYYAKNFRLHADPSGKNVSRYRYLSHDPDVLVNLDAELFPVTEGYIETITTTDELQNNIPVEAHLKDVVRLIDVINKEKIDITGVYQDWVKIGLALARNCNGTGLDYYHQISQHNPKYDYTDTTKKFNSLKKSVLDSDKPSDRLSKKKATLKSLFAIAKDHGILVRPEVSEHTSFAQLVDIAPQPKGGCVSTVFDYIRSVISAHHQVKFNTLTQRIEIDGNQLTDFIINDLWGFVASKSDGKVPDKDKLKGAIMVNTWPKYHPIKEFIETLPRWDRVDRMREIASYMSTPLEDVTYSFLSRWMTGVIHCLYGRPNPLVIVLVGDIGTGKTEFFRNLFPPEITSRFFAESHLHPRDRENTMNQNLIVFDDEMQGIKKMGNEEFKSLSSTKTFSVTRKYEAFETKLDRIASICAASNPKDILTDETNRRILPLLVVGKMNWAALGKVDRYQLLAQAYYYFTTGKAFEILGDEIEKLADYSREFEERTVEYELIDKYFVMPPENLTGIRVEYRTATDLLVELKEKSGMHNLNPNKIGIALSKIGFQRTMKRAAGRIYPGRYYAVVYGPNYFEEKM